MDEERDENQVLDDASTGLSDEANPLDDEGQQGNDEGGEWPTYDESLNAPVQAVETPIAETQAEQPRGTMTPFTPLENPFLNQIAERYGDPELAQLIAGAIGHQQQQGFAAQAYAGSYAQQSAAAVPELYTPDRNLSYHRARTPAALQGTPFGEITVALGPELERLHQTGNLPEFWNSVRAKLNGKPQPQGQRQPSHPPARTVAPAPRTPSPGAGGGGGNVSPASRQVQRSGSLASRYLQGLGYSASESKNLENKIEA